MQLAQDKKYQKLGKINSKILDIYLVPILFTLAVLVYYRNEGVRDLGFYLEAGSTLLEGGNPYTELAWRSGPVGTLVVELVFGFLPSALAIILFQSVTIFGFIFLAKPFCMNLTKAQRNFLYSIIILSAPVRETLSGKQMTGLVAFALAFAIASIHSETKPSKSIKVTSIFAIAIAVDLKPHLMAPLLLVLIFYSSARSLILKSGILLISLQVVISIYCNQFLIFDWATNILKLGNTLGESGESVSLWKVLTLVGFPDNYVFALAIASQIITLIIGLILVRQKFTLETLIATIVPLSFGTYMHVYDYSLLTTLFLVVIVTRGLSLMRVLLLMFIAIPLESFLIQNFFVLVMILFWFLVSTSVTYSNLKVLLQGFLTYYFIQGINQKLEIDYKMDLSIRILEINIMALFLVYTYAIESIRKTELEK